MDNPDEKGKQVDSFGSSLEIRLERFLSELLARTLETVPASAVEYLRHVPPVTLIQALANEPELRADVLQAATGTRRCVALAKSVASVTEDVELALRVGATTEQQLIVCLPRAVQFRLLPRATLWAIVSGPLVAVPPSAPGLLGYVLERALEHALISPQQLVEAVTLPELVASLLPEEVAAVVQNALASPHKFTHGALLEACQPRLLAARLPVALLWSKVVLPLVARPHALSASEPSESEGESGALRSRDGQPPAEPILIEDDELVEEPLLDAGDDEESARTGGSRLTHPFPDLSGIFVPEPEPENRTTSPRSSAVPPANHHREKVLGLLRDCRPGLGRLGPDTAIRDIIIAALVEFDQRAYSDRSRELSQVALEDLGNMLCHELERTDRVRAEVLRQALTDLGSGTRWDGPPRSGP